MVTSSRSSSCWMPIISIDIWQAMNSTPCANACERNDSKESTPLRFIKKRIMRLPMPNIFICDNFSFKELDGSIMPNILPKKSFCTLGFCTFFKTFSPQKVKKMVTFCPVAAAPFASTKVASALSRSSLNRISVFPLPPATETLEADVQAGAPFSMTTV